MGLTIRHFFLQNNDQDAGKPFYSASVQIIDLLFKESSKQQGHDLLQFLAILSFSVITKK